ncbi:hypothetical protein LZ683_08930 [Comamonas testosteroni]|uniref:hypothetical protein n=1 Tax=Comamonas testosteroni TaxID=285 RepID=UPI0023AAE4E8|nr:hypothetical protein [Comamonas testosteroni]WEE79465.1 hypothetical protein LZ683_08930 [Comamonas testosteroni]
MTDRRKHYINIKAGESFEIGDTIVMLDQKRGSIARLVVLADRSVPVKNPEEIKSVRRSAPLPSQGDTNGKHAL